MCYSNVSCAPCSDTISAANPNRYCRQITRGTGFSCGQNSDPVQIFIGQQMADGSFQYDAQLFENHLGLSMNQIQAKCPPGINAIIWITALDVFHNRFIGVPLGFNRIGSGQN